MEIQQIAERLVKADERRGDLALKLLDAIRLECARTSQNQFAQKIGVSAPYLSDVLKGRRGGGVSEGLARRIQEAYK